MPEVPTIAGLHTWPLRDLPSPGLVPGPESTEQAPPSLFTYFYYGSHGLPRCSYQWSMRYSQLWSRMPAADALLILHQGGTGYGEESSDDDDDAEEEHLAPADPAAVAYSADQDTYLAYRRHGLECPSAGIRRECYYLPVHETEMPEICLPLRKRPRRTTPGPGYEVGESSAAGTARQVGPATARADLYGFADMLDAAPGCQCEDEIIYSQLDDARYDRALLRARVNMLYRDRPFHRRTALLIEEEARLSRAAWARSMDACDQVHSEGISLQTTVMAQQSEITELQAADRRRQSVISDLLKADYRRQRQLVVGIKISEEASGSDDRASRGQQGLC
ncbi:hypothetical protein Tco_0774265 [Tanacetum coccineum]|uniref:Uncharacterized protein n=1 Tax=Tanacetum coccineum TaxID=301880 RepID=A0ABQ4ZN20_9ASTR